MNKTYRTKIPVSMYVNLVAYAGMAVMQLRLVLVMERSFFLIASCTFFFALMIIMWVLIAKISRKNNRLEIMYDQITLNNVNVPLERIEQIVVEGYFTQSIGIKLYGKRYVPHDLHFRFKRDEEKNVEEFRKWAEDSGIHTSTGWIRRWI